MSNTSNLDPGSYILVLSQYCNVQMPGNVEMILHFNSSQTIDFYIFYSDNCSDIFKYNYLFNVTGTLFNDTIINKVDENKNLCFYFHNPSLVNSTIITYNISINSCKGQKGGEDRYIWNKIFIGIVFFIILIILGATLYRMYGIGFCKTLGMRRRTRNNRMNLN